MDQQNESNAHSFSPHPETPPVENFRDQTAGADVELSPATSVAFQACNIVLLYIFFSLTHDQDVPDTSHDQVNTVFWTLGILLKNREDLSMLHANVLSIQNQLRQMHQMTEENISLNAAQKADVLNACKNIVYGPRRMSYHNAAIVSDVLNSAQNSFKAHFETPSSAFGQVLNKYIRDKASYAKNIIKDKWINRASERVTKAAKMLAETMVGSTVNIGLQHTGRLLLARYFWRHWDESQNPGNVTTWPFDKCSSKDHEFFTHKAHEDKGDAESKGFWNDLNDFLIWKTEGQFKHETNQTKKRRKKNDPENAPKLIKKPGLVYGADFVSAEWVKFYKERAAYEMELFPEDKIAAIPQVQPDSVPQPTSMTTSTGMQTPQIHRSNILSYPAGQFSSPILRMSGPGCYKVAAADHGPALPSHGQSSMHTLGMSTPTNTLQMQGRNTPINTQGQMGIPIMGGGVGGAGSMCNGMSSGSSGLSGDMSGGMGSTSLGRGMGGDMSSA
ncbi:hypothetical protein C8R41DRAFT_916421 [Lentinula lateritia]|uniref:Uncharacterized protein n=1 Tax=Lentinula lateritia TaxID=40482 RepID=A0ABQ8VQA9_9AGAR|nr:hypothetical protein C8R41DRAFT_916421 [Lentinula lateritia]